MPGTGQHGDEVPRAPRGPFALALLAIAFACGLALFASLGAWQVQRLHWKHDLIARVDSRIHAEAVAAPPRAEWPGIDAAT